MEDGCCLKAAKRESLKFTLQTIQNSKSNIVFSRSGGTEPRWGGDSKEIFYIAPNGKLTSLAVEDPVHLVIGETRELFKLPGQVATGAGFFYAVGEGGVRFLVLNKLPADARDLSVIFNWPQLIDSVNK